MPIDRELITKKLDFLNAHLSAIERMELAEDAFLLLGEQKIITKELAGKLGKAADFRNRVVHGYKNFDFRILFRDYKDDLAQLRDFGAQILQCLDTKH